MRSNTFKLGTGILGLLSLMSVPDITWAGMGIQSNTYVGGQAASTGLTVKQAQMQNMIGKKFKKCIGSASSARDTLMCYVQYNPSGLTPITMTLSSDISFPPSVPQGLKGLKATCTAVSDMRATLQAILKDELPKKPTERAKMFHYSVSGCLRIGRPLVLDDICIDLPSSSSSVGGEGASGSIGNARGIAILWGASPDAQNKDQTTLMAQGDGKSNLDLTTYSDSMFCTIGWAVLSGKANDSIDQGLPLPTTSKETFYQEVLRSMADAKRKASKNGLNNFQGN